MYGVLIYSHLNKEKKYKLMVPETLPRGHELVAWQ